MGLDVKSLKEKQEKPAFGDSLYFKLVEGKRNVVRILPRSMKYFTKEGDNDYTYQYYIHMNLFDVKGYKRIICKKTAGEKCPICDYAASLSDAARRKSLHYRVNHMYNVFDYETGKLKVFETGTFIYEEILTTIVDPAWGDTLFDPKSGRDVTILVDSVPQAQKGKVNPYTVKVVPDKSSIAEHLPDNWDEIIDSLQSKLPKVADEAVYLSIVEHLRKGTVPEPRESSKKEEESEVSAEAQPTPAPAPTVAPKTSAAPVESGTAMCFGLEYSSKLEKCKACGQRPDCRTKTLGL